MDNKVCFIIRGLEETFYSPKGVIVPTMYKKKERKKKALA